MVEVRFACIPSVEGVKCNLDGVIQYSNESGIASFLGVSQGLHSYSVEAPKGMMFISGYDVFDRPLYQRGTTFIEWVPIPGTPWPEDQPWMMMLNFKEAIIIPPIEAAIKIAGSAALGSILIMIAVSK